MKTVSLKLSAELNIKLERAARSSGQTKSDIVREALERYLQKERPVSALELCGDLVGKGAGPGYLSTNPDHMR
jgi:metal-responsive CopG/Arc/MetJ family transcriptional regulator